MALNPTSPAETTISTGGADWLYAGPYTLPGNVAKVKAIREIANQIRSRSETAILDIGCVGPAPFQFWEPLLAHTQNFQLTGIDVWGIRQAQEIVDARGWQKIVKLYEGSGYALAEKFQPAAFDIVVATQVLEHVADLPRFIGQVAGVLKPSGQAFFTVDSAHWRSRFDVRHPIRVLKNLAKKGFSLVGNERHYDLPWFDFEIIGTCRQAGLEVVETRYYNLAPLKILHNRCLRAEKRNEFMKLWFELEEWLNNQEEVRSTSKNAFLDLYIQVQKPVR